MLDALFTSKVTLVCIAGMAIFFVVSIGVMIYAIKTAEPYPEEELSSQDTNLQVFPEKST